MKNLFIDASKLQVGDVLLSQSTHAHSKFIAWATAGPFSHAAIYLREFQLFEAVTKGVGFSNLKPVKVERGRVLCSTEGYRKFSVYRCPPQFRGKVDNDALYLDMYPLLAGLNGVEYKRLNVFAGIKTRFDWIPSSVRTGMLGFAGKLFAGDRNKCLEEFFCSEAVAYILQKRMGMSILKTGQNPDTVSPNELADPAISNLQEVQDAVCAPDKQIANDNLALLGAQARAFRASSLKIVQSTKKLQKFTDNLLDDLLRDMRESVLSRREKNA